MEVALREPHGRSRDHTERLLRAFGYGVRESEGWIHFAPSGRVEPFEIEVPGRPILGRLPGGRSECWPKAVSCAIAGVGLNPTRTGFLEVLRRMGAAVGSRSRATQFGEPVGDLVVRPGSLSGTEVAAAGDPGLIDEIPILAVLASRAEGSTTFREVGELRVKESDRLGLMAENLRAVGARAEVSGEDLVVEGGEHGAAGRCEPQGTTGWPWPSPYWARYPERGSG